MTRSRKQFLAGLIRRALVGELVGNGREQMLALANEVRRLREEVTDLRGQLSESEDENVDLMRQLNEAEGVFE